MGGYPQSRLPVVVEIAPGAGPAADPGTWSWVDVSTSARLADGITIGAGRGDWGQDTDPGTCALTFNNPVGDFSQHNPLGQWYGKLGKDTPLRVRLRRVEDDFARTLTAGWGAAPSGQVWDVFGAGGSVLPTDSAVSGGMGRLWVPQASAYRAGWMPGVQLRDVEVVATIDTVITGVVGAAIEPAGVMLRMQDIGTYYMARVEIDAAEAVTIKLFSPSGTTLASAAVPGIVWAGQPLRVRAGINGQQLYARVWDPAAGSEPAGWQVTAVDNSATALRGRGGVGVRSGVAAGNTNTFPLEFRWSDLQVLVDLGGGFVPAWVPDSDLSGKIRTVPVTAQGTLYRHKPGQATPPVLSPWRRMVTSKAVSGLLAYWPCEDDVSATRAGSGLPGGAPMTASSSVRFGDLDDNFFANSSGVTLGFGPSLLPGTAGGAAAANVDKGTLTGAVPAGTSSPIRWSVCWMARPVTSGATYPMVRWDTPGGSITQWEYRHANVSTQSGLWGKRASDGVFVEYAALFDDAPRLREYRVEAWQDSPGGVGVRLWVDGVQILNGFFVDTLARVTQVVVNPTAADVDALAVAHIQVWDTDTPPRLGVEGMTSTAQPTDSYGVKVYPHQRWVNEAAHLRLARLCAEDGVGIDIPPVDSALAARMGQQPDGTSLDLYRDCVNTDGGILYERGFALGYRTRQSLYNQDPAIVLDARSDLADVPVPDGSGQRYRNRWTLTRGGGSSVVAETPELAVGASLPYPASGDVSLATDAQLPDQAGWRLRQTSDKGLRWPQLELDMWAHPELLDAWLSCRIGDRIVASAAPADVAGRGVDVLVEGYSLTLGYKDFRVAANCSPSWLVAAADGEARPGASGSTLAADLTSGGMSLLLASTSANGPWTEDPADMPLDVRVGGERVAVSAAAPALLDTFTRSVSSGWGAPWTIGGASAGQFLANGSVGLMGLNVTNTTFTATATGYGADYDVTVRFTPMAVAAGAQFEQMLRVRNGGGSSYYESKAQYQTSGQIDFYLQRGTTVLSAVGSAMAYSSTTVVALRMQVIGSTVRHKIWNASGAEPAAWTASVTDTALPGSPTDGIQLAARRIAGNTQNGLAVGFDNVTTLIPQSLTLSARGVNGVQRAWPARTEVDVWTPAVIAL